MGRACEDTLAQHGFVPDPIIDDHTEDMEGESALVTDTNCMFTLRMCIHTKCTFPLVHI